MPTSILGRADILLELEQQVVWQLRPVTVKFRSCQAGHDATADILSITVLDLMNDLNSVLCIRWTVIRSLRNCQVDGTKNKVRSADAATNSGRPFIETRDEAVLHAFRLMQIHDLFADEQPMLQARVQRPVTRGGSISSTTKMEIFNMFVRPASFACLIQSSDRIGNDRW